MLQPRVQLPFVMCLVAFDKAPPKAPPKPPTTAAGINRVQTREIREREKRARAFEAALAAWLARYGRHQELRIRRAMERRGIRAGVEITKAKTTLGSLEDELRDLYMRFGLQQVEAGAKRWSANLGSKFVATPELKARYARSVENKVRLMFRRNKKMVRQSLQTIVIDALQEFPRPTINEVTRRIAIQFHGDPGQKQRAAAQARQREILAIMDRERGEGRRRARPELMAALRAAQDDEQDNTLFGRARARAIARTELGDADTAGALEGFEAVGVERASWLARSNDGRSGKRMHYKMNDHKPIPVKDLAGSDRSKYFKLPSGARGRRPMDPMLPVGERVNCRCVLLPER